MDNQSQAIMEQYIYPTYGYANFPLEVLDLPVFASFDIQSFKTLARYGWFGVEGGYAFPVVVRGYPHESIFVNQDWVAYNKVRELEEGLHAPTADLFVHPVTNQVKLILGDGHHSTAFRYGIYNERRFDVLVKNWTNRDSGMSLASYAYMHSDVFNRAAYGYH